MNFRDIAHWGLGHSHVWSADSDEVSYLPLDGAVLRDVPCNEATLGEPDHVDLLGLESGVIQQIAASHLCLRLEVLENGGLDSIADLDALDD